MELLIVAALLGGIYLFTKSQTPKVPVPPTPTGAAPVVAPKNQPSVNLPNPTHNNPTSPVDFLAAMAAGPLAASQAAAQGLVQNTTAQGSNIAAAGIGAAGTAASGALGGAFNLFGVLSKSGGSNSPTGAVQIPSGGSTPAPLALNPPSPSSGGNLDESGYSQDDWGIPVADPLSNGSDPTAAIALPGSDLFSGVVDDGTNGIGAWSPSAAISTTDIGIDTLSGDAGALEAAEDAGDDW